MVSYDFVLRFAPKLSESTRVRLGRGVMIAVLVLCVGLAPGIKEFKGVFGYLVQLWSLLAPPVFVCVVAGIFTRRASGRGAMLTLAVGAALGAVTFWVLSRPELVAQLPRYLRSALNCGFVITLICAAVMALGSGGGPRPGADEFARERSSAVPMTPGERRTYRVTLAVLFTLWLSVVLAFSPWGLARALSSVPPGT
jgi:Na+/proline symporter